MKFQYVLVLAMFMWSCKSDLISKMKGSETISYENGRLLVHVNRDKFENGQVAVLHYEGIDFMNERDFDKAKLKFHEGLLIEPKNPSLLNDLGNVEHELKNYRDAILYFEKSVEVSDSLYLNAGLNLGLLYWKNYEFKKSAKILEHVLLKSDKKYERSLAHYQLAHTYYDMNACKKSKIELEKVIPEFQEFKEIRSRLKNLKMKVDDCL